MISNFAERFRESLSSVVPVMVLVLALHFTIAPLQAGQVTQFLMGGVLLILGLTIFLVGADIGMVPFGQMVGSALTHKRNLLLILVASFAIGFAITIAEPDVQVLATQVNLVAPAIEKTHLVYMIALGVGLFLTLGAARIILRLPLAWLLILFYILLFGASSFVESEFISVAFDAGGATTGPITVPFIMAMGLGVAAAAKTDGESDSGFGMVGLASIGPIAAVVLMGFISNVDLKQGNEEVASVASVGSLAYFIEIFPEVGHEVAKALLPLLAIFLFFQFTLLRLPLLAVKRMLLGLFYTLLGLTIFMVGVNGGFSPVGTALGMALGMLEWPLLLIPIGLVLGAVVVCAEPAVWVLTEQVEEVSGGYIGRRVMLVALSLSVALAVGIGMLRVVEGISIWWALVPGYSLALILTRFCPPLFTAIAFDSGGVASGPMATTFVLSLTLGASYALGGNPITDAFGMVAMIAMAPLVTIQVLGLLFRYMEYKKAKQDKDGAEHMEEEDV